MYIFLGILAYIGLGIITVAYFIKLLAHFKQIDMVINVVNNIPFLVATWPFLILVFIIKISLVALERLVEAISNQKETK